MKLNKKPGFFSGLNESSEKSRELHEFTQIPVE